MADDFDGPNSDAYKDLAHLGRTVSLASGFGIEQAVTSAINNQAVANTLHTSPVAGATVGLGSALLSGAQSLAAIGARASKKWGQSGFVSCERR